MYIPNGPLLVVYIPIHHGCKLGLANKLLLIKPPYAPIRKRGIPLLRNGPDLLAITFSLLLRLICALPPLELDLKQ